MVGELEAPQRETRLGGNFGMIIIRLPELNTDKSYDIDSMIFIWLPRHNIANIRRPDDLRPEIP